MGLNLGSNGFKTRFKPFFTKIKGLLVVTSKKEEVLRQLKIVRKTKNLSYQDIVDGTEEIGEAVSLSTVKRVFAEGSSAADFRYDTTIRPIVRFVLGIDGDSEEPQTFEEAKVTTEALTSVVDLKDTMISRLESELARHREDEQYQKRFFEKELELARAERDAKERSLNTYRKTTFIFMALFILALILVIAYISIDHSTPHFGLFWTANALSSTSVPPL